MQSYSIFNAESNGIRKSYKLIHVLEIFKFLHIYAWSCTKLHNIVNVCKVLEGERMYATLNPELECPAKDIVDSVRHNGKHYWWLCWFKGLMVEARDLIEADVIFWDEVSITSK